MLGTRWWEHGDGNTCVAVVPAAGGSCSVQGQSSALPPSLAWNPPRRGQRLVYEFSPCVSCDKKVLAGSAGFSCSLLAFHPADCLSWEPVALSDWICFQISPAKRFFSPLLAMNWQP